VVKVGETDLEPKRTTLPILVIEQVMAYIDDHVRVELCPDKMRLGLAEIEQVGGGTIKTAAGAGAGVVTINPIKKAMIIAPMTIAVFMFFYS